MTELVVIAGCLVVNALLSAFEMAFVSVSKPELRQLARKGNVAAGRLLVLRETPERTLSVLQIGITLVGAISAAVGGAGAEESLAPLFESRLGVREETAEAMAIGAIVIPLTYFSVVLGELIPKTIAIRQPRPIALRGSRVLKMADQTLHPLVTFLEKSTQVFLSPFPFLKTAPQADDTSIQLDDLSVSQQEYVVNVVKLEKLRIRDIMIPWSQVDTIRADQVASEVLTRVAESGHTRHPVVDSERNVVGILNSKEFLAMTLSGNFDWQSVVREPVRVKAGDDLLKTLRLLQASRRHMATVDEGGEAIGIVTLEDIIEEIIGDVQDEDDDGLSRRLIANRARLRSP